MRKSYYNLIGIVAKHDMLVALGDFTYASWIEATD